MRIVERGGRLIVTDRPVGYWLFGLMFVAGGAVALSAPFVATNWDTQLPWVRGLVLLIGLAHLSVGSWWIRHSPTTVTELDRVGGVGRHRVRAPGARAGVVTEFALGDVRRVDLVEERDDDGDPTWRLGLRLATGRLLPLHAHPWRGVAPRAGPHDRVRAFLASAVQSSDSPPSIGTTAPVT